MGAEHWPVSFRLALVVAPGRVLDVPDGLVAAILAAEPTVRRECVKWSGMFGAGGRVILVDPDLVDRILSRWPEMKR